MAPNAAECKYTLTHKHCGFLKTAQGSFRGSDNSPARYRAYWFSAMTAETIDLPEVSGPEWKSPEPPDQNDWALLLRAM
jgi:hypothetical protein